MKEDSEKKEKKKKKKHKVYLYWKMWMEYLGKIHIINNNKQYLCCCLFTFFPIRMQLNPFITQNTRLYQLKKVSVLPQKGPELSKWNTKPKNDEKILNLYIKLCDEMSCEACICSFLEFWALLLLEKERR